MGLQEQLERWQERLEAQNGRILANRCESVELESVPSRGLKEPGHTQACGGVCRAIFPYTSHQGEAHQVIVCGYCDSATEFPRFA